MTSSGTADDVNRSIMLPGKALLSVLLCFGPALSATPAARPAYATSAGWAISTLPGPGDDQPSLWTREVGACASWSPAFDGPVRARVWFYKVRHSEENDPGVPLTIVHAGGATTRSVDFSAGSEGWVDLGVFSFSGDDSERVKLTKVTPGCVTRAAAVRFDVLDASGSASIQSFTLARPTRGPSAAAWPAPIRFTDLDGRPERLAIETLATRGLLNAGNDTRFHPDRPASATGFRSALTAVLQLINPLSAARDPLPTVDDGLLSASRARELAITAAQTASRKLPSADASIPILVARFIPSGDSPLTRAAAAMIIRRFEQTFLEAGPPISSPWELTLRDEFDGDAPDWKIWRSEAGAPGHILSSRWPENVTVQDGVLQLRTRKEQRGGRDWTTGYIWTRTFAQQYGYFEARLRIGRASGLNNAFWLMTDGQPSDPIHFEIDITESKYPSRANLTLHQWSGKHRAYGQVWVTAENLADDFHTYACEWHDSEIVWYVDGREVMRQHHDFARRPCSVRLSSAVGDFAGRISDRLDGTTMEVDWVRVWRKARPSQE